MKLKKSIKVKEEKEDEVKINTETEIRYICTKCTEGNCYRDTKFDKGTLKAYKCNKCGHKIYCR
jgi:predicted RNA-binding Zn-ribbon protein involved in translation (DUF1610 family)